MGIFQKNRYLKNKIWCCKFNSHAYVALMPSESEMINAVYSTTPSGCLADLGNIIIPSQLSKGNFIAEMISETLFSKLMFLV